MLSESPLHSTHQGKELCSGICRTHLAECSTLCRQRSWNSARPQIFLHQSVLRFPRAPKSHHVRTFILKSSTTGAVPMVRLLDLRSRDRHPKSEQPPTNSISRYARSNSIFFVVFSGIGPYTNAVRKIRPVKLIGDVAGTEEVID